MTSAVIRRVIKTKQEKYFSPLSWKLTQIQLPRNTKYSYKHVTKKELKNKRIYYAVFKSLKLLSTVMMSCIVSPQVACTYSK